jgi:hypothetical protein
VTRFIHDQFAKQYLSELLSPLGTVEANKEVSSEVRYIDLFFTPFDGENPRRDDLGLLGRLTTTPALFEPFRNPVSKNEIRTCLLKLLTLQQEWERQANRDQTRVSEDQLPRLWILTPTASANLLDSCNAVAAEAGIYFCGDTFKTAFIVIHQLPPTPQTLWLRLLGRGSGQRQAVLELEALPPDLPLRADIIKLVRTLISLLTKRQQNQQDLDREDRELIMTLTEMYEEAMADIRQEAKAESNRSFVEAILETRFGSVDEELAAIVESIASLPVEEYTPLLLNASRAELLDRFSSTSE